MDAQISIDHEHKWQGKAAAKLERATADSVWPLIEDFCAIHKWLPTIDTSYKLHGTERQPGLLRYCAATLPPPSDGLDPVVKWCHEKLLAVDPIKRRLSYEVLENNMGFKSYESTVEVVAMDDVHGCVIEWSFVADPVEGLSYEDLVAYLDLSLQGMAQNLEKALMESTT